MNSESEESSFEDSQYSDEEISSRSIIRTSKKCVSLQIVNRNLEVKSKYLHPTKVKFAQSTHRNICQIY